MSNEKIKRIPYGLANYEQLVRQNCYYVDKTMYLEMLENAGNYLFFIRPRRFGKSLFISIMEAYYDVYYKDRFEELFRGTAIHKQPTEEKGSYLILAFNFSVVDPTHANVEISFLNYVRGEAISFIRKYDNHLIADKESYIQTIEQSQSSADILSALIRLCKDSHQKIYVLVDEYDNFANTILSTAGEHAYKDLTHGEGFFRSFFNVLKSGTTGMGAPISRLFITGVSPITMDDVTSGFNIGKNVSLLPHFNPMLGFTENEVEQMIDYYRGKGLIKQETTGPAAIIKEWYGNYLFSEDADKRLFNSDMVLYFIDNYLTGGKIPQDLIDRNVRIDYGKLRHLILVDQSKEQGRTTNGNFQRLKEIIENGGISSKLEKAFPLEQLKNPKNFTSLLFYFGLLTIQGIERDKLRFIIPNETVKRLYYYYITEA